MTHPLRIGSLFSGIGGLELGLERAGVGTTAWQVEQDPYCRAVLAKHWPAAVRHDDVRTVGASTLSPVDVICGGFPCQDISVAGRGAGLDGARSGLWFEYLRIVQELRPHLVIIENVAALRTRGLDTVLAGLHDAGYRTEWALAAAADVGAPHRRKRLFVVAVADAASVGERKPPASTDAVPVGGEARGVTRRDGETLADADSLDDRPRRLPVGAASSVAVLAQRGEPLGDADCQRRGERHGAAVSGPEKKPAAAVLGRRVDRKPAESGVGRGSDGIRFWLDRVASGGARWPQGPGPTQHDWEQPRVARKVAARAARLRALGNAVVPQVAEAVGLWALSLLETDRRPAPVSL